MKRINLFLFLVLTLFLLTSCAKIKEYDSTTSEEYIDLIYNHIDKDKEYLLIDARSLEEYAKGHFFGFINYDIEKGTLDEFGYKIESMHSKDKSIFIIDEDGRYVESLASVLLDAGYKKIYIYTSGFNKLNEYNNDDFQIVTGTDDCEC